MPTDANLPQIIAGIIGLVIMTAGIAADCVILTALEKRKIKWREHLQQLRDRPWNYYDGLYILLILATVFTAILLGSSIIDKLGIEIPEYTRKIIIIAETIFMHITIIAAIETLRRRQHRSFTECFFTPEQSLLKSAKQAVTFYCAVIPPIVIISTLANLMLKHLSFHIQPQEIMQDFVDPDAPVQLTAALILIAVVFAPVIEEITFRGILLPIALKHTRPVFAIASVSLLFALIHTNLQAVAPLFVLAVGLSLSYLYTRTIIVPMMIHAIFNTISLTLYFLATS